MARICPGLLDWAQVMKPETRSSVHPTNAGHQRYAPSDTTPAWSNIRVIANRARAKLRGKPGLATHSRSKFAYDCRSPNRVSRSSLDFGYPSGDLTPARRKAGRFFVQRARPQRSKDWSQLTRATNLCAKRAARAFLFRLPATENAPALVFKSARAIERRPDASEIASRRKRPPTEAASNVCHQT